MNVLGGWAGRRGAKGDAMGVGGGGVGIALAAGRIKESIAL